jgi:hypothetical protein
MSAQKEHSNNNSHAKRENIMFYVLYVRTADSLRQPPLGRDDNTNPLFVAIRKAVQKREDQNIVKEEATVRRYYYVLETSPTVHLTSVPGPAESPEFEEYYTFEFDRTHE